MIGGPWTVVRRRDGAAISPVGLVLFGSIDEEQERALRLAAAAPELLEAALLVLYEFNLDDLSAFTRDQCSALRQAERAVAKARGK